MPQVTLIHPSRLERDVDFTSVMSIPLGLAYLASALRSGGVDVQLIDGLGSGVRQRHRVSAGLSVRGLDLSSLARAIDPHTDLVAIETNYSSQHELYVQLMAKIRAQLPHVPIVLGGHHATALPETLLNLGADYILLGEAERSLLTLCLHLGSPDHALQSGIAYHSAGQIVVKPQTELIADIDTLPFPARELFPQHHYWELQRGHGPVNGRFTPILSSRGCPYDCAFCSSASFWNRSWRARSPANVVQEIEQCVERFGIREFHFEDDNLALNKERVVSLCHELIERRLGVRWALPNGVRAEHLDHELLRLMKHAGCVQLSLAPESGSRRIRKQVFAKHINVEQHLRIVRACSQLGIQTQAFFICGAPTETKKDRLQTRRLVDSLARAGLDEIAVFDCIPYPGTRLADLVSKRPRWQDLRTSGYGRGSLARELFRGRLNLYGILLFRQLTTRPQKVARLIQNLVQRRQETKADRLLAQTFQWFR